MYRFITRLAPVTVAGLGCFLLVSACSLNGSYETVPDTGATLTGTVKYNNQPVTAGLVMAESKNTDGRPAGTSAQIGPDGRFLLTNVPLGEVALGVNTMAAKAQVIGQAYAKNAAAAANGKSQKVETSKFVDVPTKYADPLKSPIKTTIQPGDNKFDIVLD
jgi:hypothetical protein